MGCTFHERLGFQPELPRPLYYGLHAVPSTRHRGLTAESKRITSLLRVFGFTPHPKRPLVRHLITSLPPVPTRHAMRHLIMSRPWLLAALLLIVFPGPTLAAMSSSAGHCRCSYAKLVPYIEYCSVRPCRVPGCPGTLERTQAHLEFPSSLAIQVDSVAGLSWNLARLLPKCFCFFKKKVANKK